jgi:hypothetical protein
MPIRPENKARYPKDWKAISARIRERAGDCCEECGIPNGATVENRQGRMIVVVLTVAHLDHTPENCTDDNLRAWCQKCHNSYDAPTRARGIRERARMTRRELNKTDFELIEKAFELVVAHFQKMTDKTILLRVEELRQEFKDAHTGWLWFEEKEGK